MYSKKIIKMKFIILISIVLNSACLAQTPRDGEIKEFFEAIGNNKIETVTEYLDNNSQFANVTMSTQYEDQDFLYLHFFLQSGIRMLRL